MAAAQETFRFPLLTLPENYQLVIIYSKSLKGSAENITFLSLLPDTDKKTKNKADNFLNFPKSKSIKAILYVRTAYERFEEVFDRIAKNKHCHLSIKKK